MEKQQNNLELKWWFRIAKVAYIFLYLFLAVALVAGGIDNFYKYSIDGESIIYTPGSAIANFLIGGVIGLAMIRAMKIIFFYIFLAEKPRWKRELTKIF